MPKVDKSSYLKDSQLVLKVMNLRKAGWKVNEIALNLQIKPSVVSFILKKMLRREYGRLRRSAQELYAIEYDRLEDLNKVLYLKINEVLENPKKFDRSTLEAVKLLNEVSKRRSEMLGLDEPMKQQITVNHQLQGFSQLELEEEAKKLGINTTLTLPNSTPLLLPGEEVEEAEFIVKEKEEDDPT